MFFALVPSKAGKLGFSAVVALLSVLGGFHYAADLLPQRAPEMEGIETRSSGQPRTKEQEKPKFEVSAKREPPVETTGQTNLKALAAEQEIQVASPRHKLCLSMAKKNYEMIWAANCKTISVQDRKRHERCIAQVDTKAVCAPLARASSETCALPVELASRLNKELEEIKIRCGPESGPTSPQLR